MFDHWQLQQGPFFLRGQTERLVADESMASKLQNLRLTERGTLRTVRGPAQYHPRNWVGGTGKDVNYGFPMDGIFHCRLRGGARDVLLYVGKIGDNYGVWEHHGWSQSWNLLIGEDAGADYQIKLDDRAHPKFLTQFVSTPSGVIILLQGHFPMFYDGQIVAPLGYSTTPAPPEPRSPRTKKNTDNSTGTHSASLRGSDLPAGYYKTTRTMNQAFGFNRIGSLEFGVLGVEHADSEHTNELGGILTAGARRARTQWIDRWGNLSPASQPSAPCTWMREDNLSKHRKRQRPEDARAMRLQVAWESVARGPDRTIGRIVGLTRDLVASGDSTFYEAPNYATDGHLAFATIPDNAADLLPDNIPDAWLLAPMNVDVVPMQDFKLAVLAFGRCWFANSSTQPGLLRPSMIGRWGTTTANHDIYPDATGEAITGLHAVSGGLLVFTETSTFLITVDDSGDSFRAATIHPSVGCVAPSSIATLPNGLTIWLSREGFHAFDGDEIRDVSSDIKLTCDKISPTWRLRACAAVDTQIGEYRCWLPLEDGGYTHPNGALVVTKSATNLCMVTADGENWTERNDVQAAGVCVTKDERELMLVAGKAPCQSDPDDNDVYEDALPSSVWVLDHEQHGLQKSYQHTATVETHWLRAERSGRRGSPVKVTLWFIETQKSNMVVEVMRDWRSSPVIHTINSGERAPTLYPNDDSPLFYDVDEINGTRIDPWLPRQQAVGHTFRSRRPYWSRVDISVPSCEVFKIRLAITGDAEFVAIGFGENPAHSGGAKIVQGVR